jgi:hypothetical protein
LVSATSRLGTGKWQTFFYSVLLITPYTAPIKLQEVQLHLLLHLFNHLEQVQKRPTQSPATAVRNILVQLFSPKSLRFLRFAKNFCAFGAVSKKMAASALLTETLRFLGNPCAYCAFFKNPALTNRLLCLVIAFFYDFCMRKSFMPVIFAKTVCLKTPRFCIPHLCLKRTKESERMGQT